jgi:hypothetical protein
LLARSCFHYSCVYYFVQFLSFSKKNWQRYHPLVIGVYFVYTFFYKYSSLLTLEDISPPGQVRTILDCAEAMSYNNTKNATISYFEIAPTSLRTNWTYYNMYFIGANTLFGHLIPFIFLVILNILIVNLLRKRKKEADVLITQDVRRLQRGGAIRRPTNSVRIMKSLQKNLSFNRSSKPVTTQSMTVIGEFNVIPASEDTGVISPGTFGLANYEIPFIDRNSILFDEDFVVESRPSPSKHSRLNREEKVPKISKKKFFKS